MKKKFVIIGACVLIAVIIFGIVIGNYNGLVNKENDVFAAQANIQTLLQKRSDKIPNLVATVKGYADYESETYKAVTEARAAVSKAGTVTELDQAEQDLNKALTVWVNAVTEAYPDLKANQTFMALMDEISSIENEIQYGRKTYNEKAVDYNKAIRKIPGNIFALIFGFEKVDLFSASAGAENVPQVSF